MSIDFSASSDVADADSESVTSVVSSPQEPRKEIQAMAADTGSEVEEERYLLSLLALSMFSMHPWTTALIKTYLTPF